MWIPALQKVQYSCTKFTETNTFNKLKSALSGESPSEHTLLEQGTGRSSPDLSSTAYWTAKGERLHGRVLLFHHHTASSHCRMSKASPACGLSGGPSVQRGGLLNKGATERFSSYHCDWNPDTDNLIEQRLLGLTILEACYCMVAGRAPTVVACSHGTEEEAGLDCLLPSPNPGHRQKPCKHFTSTGPCLRVLKSLFLLF